MPWGMELAQYQIYRVRGSRPCVGQVAAAGDTVSMLAVSCNFCRAYGRQRASAGATRSRFESRGKILIRRGGSYPGVASPASTAERVLAAARLSEDSAIASITCGGLSALKLSVTSLRFPIPLSARLRMQSESDTQHKQAVHARLVSIGIASAGGFSEVHRALRRAGEGLFAVIASTVAHALHPLLSRPHEISASQVSHPRRRVPFMSRLRSGAKASEWFESRQARRKAGRAGPS
jgi:hypothetical protein